MDNQTHLLFAEKLLETCNSNNQAAIYSTIPLFDKKAPYFRGLFAYSFKNIPNILNSSIGILTNNKIEARKTSYEYKSILESKETILETLNIYNQTSKNKITKISSDKILALLSYLSHIYLDAFTKPVQCFIPDSSSTIGQFDFWDSINFLRLRKRIYDKDFQFEFRKELAKSNIWNIKLKLDMFNYSIKERVIKDKSINKKLEPEAMVKALIIRIGELSLKHINYEVLDLAVRDLIDYIGIRKYIRADREIMFLRFLEKEIMKIMKELL